MQDNVYPAGLRFREIVLTQQIRPDRYAALVLDLCSERGDLKPALLDMVGRPLFQDLPFTGSPAQQSLARDRLLTELQPLYRFEVLEQLMDFIEGALGYTETPHPPESEAQPERSGEQTGLSNSAWQGGDASNWNDPHQYEDDGQTIAISASSNTPANPGCSRPALLLEGISALLAALPLAASFAAGVMEGLMLGHGAENDDLFYRTSYLLATYWCLSLISTVSTRSPITPRKWLGLTGPKEILGGIVFAYSDRKNFFQTCILLATLSWLIVALPAGFLGLI